MARAKSFCSILPFTFSPRPLNEKGWRSEKRNISRRVYANFQKSKVRANNLTHATPNVKSAVSYCLITYMYYHLSTEKSFPCTCIGCVHISTPALRFTTLQTRQRHHVSFSYTLAGIVFLCSNFVVIFSPWSRGSFLITATFSVLWRLFLELFSCFPPAESSCSQTEWSIPLKIT